MNLTGKVALVTGSGKGIGRATALKLAEYGADVIINDLFDQASSVVDEISAFGRQSLFIKADVGAADEVNRMMDTAFEKFGRLDILVNNAGITRDQLVIRMTDQDWDDVIRVNLKSVFLCCRAALKYMMKQRGGRIINISSISGVIGNPGQANYCAAKAGIIGITRTIAKEMASRQITVNAICPGFIETDMSAKLPEKLKEEARKRIPLGFFGAPEDIAEMVAFLASDKSRFITGQYFCVDGGMTTSW